MNLSHCTAHPGKVIDIFYGTEDHGILTCNVTCEGAWGGQGFGTLVLDERTGPEFKHGVMDSFGVANFGDLIGKPCILYRSQYTQLAEAYRILLPTLKRQLNRLRLPLYLATLFLCLK